ncbi:hypothetical protein [Plesiomonas sp. ZOR0011]|uniref:hypothetical protein n=1 Tax=Plesiomonas sp. ZOR0011 TaxID=1339230 RepID=UPI000907AEB8|nr:hypothetical protein [Plesiomonas sp. ZOR0011]
MSKHGRWLLLGALCAPLTLPAYAASDAECSIWLCLPTGFPSGCGEAKSAFLKRIKNRKSPLPSFSSCSAPASSLPPGTPVSNMTSQHGIAAVMSYSRQCTQWGVDTAAQPICGKWEMKPDKVIRGTSCRVYGNKDHKYRRPEGCLGTTDWVETYMDGQKYGDTFYY